MKVKATYATEAELCAAFIACIGDKWVAYAETAGWDILLVRKDDGCQVGIEAKLKLNAWVLAQSLDGLASTWRQDGPDYRAILVPAGSSVDGVRQIADQIGITVISVNDAAKNGGDIRYGYNPAFRPDLPDLKHSHDNRWHEWLPARRHTLPDFVPDVAAGNAAPVQLTVWKVKALKLAVLLETRGAVHRADFVALRLDPRRWTDKWTGWLVTSPAGYVAGERMPDFKGQHPKVYADLVATIDDWAHPSSLPPAVQLKLPDQPEKPESSK